MTTSSLEECVGQSPKHSWLNVILGQRSKTLAKITPVIITYNEAQNIERTLNKLLWANDILIVDSFSDDETLDIARRYSQVRILQRQFDSFANQCNFALEHGNLKTDWILNLDADYVLTGELVEELKNHNFEARNAGYRARFVYCVEGKKLRSGIYPPVTVLFRKDKARFISDGHAHRVVVDGEIGNLRAPIMHDDRKPLSRWLQSQITYTALEAQKLRSTDKAKLNVTDRLRQLRVVAPLLMPFYCLVVRGGVLDGSAGLYYAFQRTIAELMLSLYLFDQRSATKLSKRISRATSEFANKGVTAEGQPYK